MTAYKIADFLDRLSMRVRKNTFVVLDNASVHRCKLLKELRPIWEKRGLFLFFLPPYSPHLNIEETLWRILKGKWLRPMDHFSTDSLLYATNRALAALGSGLNINFAHAVSINYFYDLLKERYITHYSITSVTSDTIWLRCNASYFVYPDSVGEISSGMVEFLERVKDD